jgi:hypothetical protein
MRAVSVVRAVFRTAVWFVASLEFICLIIMWLHLWSSRASIWHYNIEQLSSTAVTVQRRDEPETTSVACVLSEGLGDLIVCSSVPGYSMTKCNSSLDNTYTPVASQSRSTNDAVHVSVIALQDDCGAVH